MGALDPRGRPLRLAVDTGAAETIIVPDVLDELGYNPRQGEAITVMRSAVGYEQGYLIRIERFDSLGIGSAISEFTSRTCQRAGVSRV